MRMQERLAGITREHDALLLGAQAALEERAQMQAMHTCVIYIYIYIHTYVYVYMVSGQDPGARGPAGVDPRGGRNRKPTKDERACKLLRTISSMLKRNAGELATCCVFFDLVVEIIYICELSCLIYARRATRPWPPRRRRATRR